MYAAHRRDILIYAGLFCLTRGEAKAEPANPARRLPKAPPVTFHGDDRTKEFAIQEMVR